MSSRDGTTQGLAIEVEERLVGSSLGFLAKLLLGGEEGGVGLFKLLSMAWLKICAQAVC